MSPDEDQSAKVFACTQCTKVFATRSNLKRHMENPNIHNIPYVRSRDQKRWKGHSKKVVTKEETTESNNDRMRKWRAENREKNRRNDLRCRVYRLARQKFGDHDTTKKQAFVREEIARRLGRRLMMEQRETAETWQRETSAETWESNEMVGLPFYSAPQQKIELPKLSWSSTPSPVLPSLSPRSSVSSSSSSSSQDVCVLPSMDTLLQSPTTKYRESNNILDEFVGVVLNYVDSQ